MNSLMLNLGSFVLLGIIGLITILLKSNITITTDDLMWTTLLMVPYLCFHEVLHSIGYMLHGAKFKNITYGAHIEKGVLCCLCKQNVSKKCILISLLYPFVFIGIITYIIGMILNINILIFLSIVNISGCTGDLLMFFSFVGLKDFEYSEFDDPTSFGLYSSIDYSKKKFFGLNYIKETDELEKNDFKKVTISKTSIIMFVFLIALSLINLFL